MPKKKKKPEEPITQLSTYKRIRKGWGALSPVTKVKPSKKKKSRDKLKRDLNKELDNDI